MARFWFALVFCSIALPFGVAQSAATGDVQAQTLAARSLATLTGEAQIRDVTLSGTISLDMGDEVKTGTAVLMANTSSSRVEWTVDNDKRSDVFNGAIEAPVAAWSTNDGPSKRYASPNSWGEGTWFFPALSRLANPNAVLAYVGTEKRYGTAVEHLQSSRKNDWVAMASQWSQVDFYLDATTLVPVALKFNLHPDSDSSVNVPVEIRFADYQVNNGVLIPMHVQKYLNYHLVMDIAVTNVTLNSNLPDTLFSVQ